mgnify:CR=1 FL=1
MSLSRHFALEEFLASEIAERKGIDNTPTPEIEATLAFTAAGMELVRAALGNIPIHINSGYRCQKLNAAVGGSANSQHVKGEACDFIAPDFGTPFEVAKELAGFVPEIGFDQLALEFGRWIHISFVEGPARGMVLTIDRAGTHKGLTA